MSKGAASLDELPQAFTSILPSSGEVILHSSSRADTSILKEAAVCFLRVHSFNDTHEPTTETDLLEVVRQHLLSMGALSKSGHILLEQHALNINQLMRSNFGKPALFIDHGATCPHEAGSCIDHAHWYCLPDAGTVIHGLARLGIHGISGPLLKAGEAYASHQPRLLAGHEGAYWFFRADNLPGQFMRLSAAEGTVHPNSRWQHLLETDGNRERYGDTLRFIMLSADAPLCDLNANCDRESSEETPGV
jgi:hypothetical protein